MDEKNTSEKINVLFVSPGKHAEMREIGETLEDMQKAVGGYIEEYMPFEDDVAIVCNEEGKMLGLPLNRGIKDEEGHLLDIIAGDFFICYAPLDSERFLSLPPDLEKKYSEKFALPEQFFTSEKGIKCVPYEPKAHEKMQAQAR